MEENKARQDADPKVEQPRNSWWARLVGYVKRKRHERKTKKKQETPVDRAARRTANATVWIAAFTVVMALVAVGTLYEIVDGGSDTHDLARAAMVQAMLQIPGEPKAAIDYIGVYPGFDKPFVDVRFRNSAGGAIVDARSAITLSFDWRPPATPYRNRIDKNRYQELQKIILPTPAGIGPALRQYESEPSDGQIETFIHDGARAYVWGIVEYHSVDSARIVSQEFCRSVLAKDVFSKKRFSSQQEIEDGSATQENRVNLISDNCHAN